MFNRLENDKKPATVVLKPSSALELQRKELSEVYTALGTALRNPKGGYLIMFV